MDTKQAPAALNEQARAVILNHVQGFNAVRNKMLSVFQEYKNLTIKK